MKGLLVPCLCCVVLLGLLHPTDASGQQRRQDSDLTARIDALFADYDGHAPGVQVAVRRNGKLVHSAGYGLANLEYDVPITTETTFHVASVSKQFTAMAVLLLVEDGKLTLDDDIRRHLPELPDYGHTVTIRHLLTHMSGLPEWWELMGAAGWMLWDDAFRQRDVMDIIRRQDALIFPPGIDFWYTNSGFTVAAEIVARVSGQPFQEFTRERIFEPLGMSRTHFHHDHRLVEKNRAYSYFETRSGYANSVSSNGFMGPAGMCSTAEELTLWLQNYGTPVVGTRSTVSLMQTRARLNDGTPVSYGLGLDIGEYRGVPVVGHGGIWAGFYSYAAWFPRQETAIVVVSNLAGFPMIKKVYEVADEVLAEALAPMTTVALSQDALPKFEGRYETIFGTVEIEHVPPDLLVQGAFIGPDTLDALSDSSFMARRSGARYVFHRIHEGRVDSLTYYWAVAGLPGRRVKPKAAFDSAVDVGVYTGAYYSAALDVTYEIIAKEGRLVGRQRRHGDFPLKPTAPDVFECALWFCEEIRFTRGPDDAVTGFGMSSWRAKNFRFVKRNK